MEKLLFESKGTPQKKKEASRSMGKMGLIIGVAALLFSFLFADSNDEEVFALWMFLFTGGIVIAISGIYFLMKSAGDNDETKVLAIYEDYVEVFNKTTHQLEHLSYAQIYSVKKVSGFDLFLETEKGNYVVSIEEINKASHIIEDKLNGFKIK